MSFMDIPDTHNWIMEKAKPSKIVCDKILDGLCETCGAFHIKNFLEIALRYIGSISDWIETSLRN